MAKEKLGFIGLGMMGGPMASNLVKAGHPIIVCDPVDEAAERLVEIGAERVATPKEVAEIRDKADMMLKIQWHVWLSNQPGANNSVFEAQLG